MPTTTDRFAALTNAERKCLAMAAEGNEAKDIAIQLNISVNTVYGHSRSIIAKTGHPSMRRAVLAYRRQTSPQRLSDQPVRMDCLAQLGTIDGTERQPMMVQDVAIPTYAVQPEVDARIVNPPARDDGKGDAGTRALTVAKLTLAIVVIVLLASPFAEGFQQVARSIASALR